MPVLNLVSLLTFYEETDGQGIGPNGTSGVSTGTEWETAESAGDAYQMPHIASSLDLSSVVKEEFTPDSPRRRVKETQRAQVGLSATQTPFQTYLTGRGATLADGATATATALSRALENAMGGVLYTATRTAAGGGHSVTVVNLDSVATLAVGAVVAWEDPDGVKHPRVITNITGLAVTVEPAFPAVPSDDDLVRGGATLYIDEAVLTDTSTNSGSTLSAVAQKGANGSAGWELNMGKLQLTSIGFARNGFATLDLTLFAARHTDPSAGPDPEFPTAVFPTPPIMGPSSTIIIGDAGTTTIGTVCNGSVTIDPGLTVTPLECMADNLDTTEGIGLYTMSPADTTIEVDLFPLSTSWYTDKAARTNKRIAVIKNGTDGNCYGFFAQNCEIQAISPGNEELSSVSPGLRAVEVNPSTATTALERSVFRIYLG